MKVEFEYLGHMIVVERGMDSVMLTIDGDVHEVVKKNGVMSRVTNTTLRGKISRGQDMGDTVEVKIVTGFFTDDAILFYNGRKIIKKTMFAI